MNTKEEFIYVIQDKSGTFYAGQSSNPGKAIATWNTPNKQVRKIIGVKDLTEDRTLDSVFNKLTNRYGENNVKLMPTHDELMDQYNKNYEEYKKNAA